MASLVIVAHGSHLNPDSRGPSIAHAQRLSQRDCFDRVQPAYWKEEPPIRDVFRCVPEGPVIVVPLFISEGYFTETVIPRELQLREHPSTGWDSPDGVSAGWYETTTMDTDQPVYYTGPVGTHDAMAEVILKRAIDITADPAVGPETELVIVGHGTDRNPHSARAIEYQADILRSRDRFGAVTALFMDESPEVEALTEYVSHERVVVVPLFIADGYHTQEDIPEDIGLTDDYRSGYSVPARVDGHEVYYTGAVGTEASVSEVIFERARETGAIDPSSDHREGHPSKPSESDPTRYLLDVADAGIDLTWLTVEPINGSYRVKTAEREARLNFSDLESFFEGRQALTAEGAYWHQLKGSLSAAEYSYLRWLEGADTTPPIDRIDRIETGQLLEWGECSITITGTPGSRRYSLSHRSATGESKHRLNSPQELHDIVLTDESNAYRPLKSAPTLRRDWTLESLSPRAFLKAVNIVYPASIGNWWRDETDTLDVSHFASTADRQTGIYANVDDLSPQAVDWLASACCTDSMCLKRRRWDYDENTDLSTERGNGSIPCREPCSLFIAAARAINTAKEGGSTGTETLTSSERDHLEAISEARAEGTFDDIRIGDVNNPLNRYRRRYLTAKYGRDLLSDEQQEGNSNRDDDGPN